MAEYQKSTRYVLEVKDTEIANDLVASKEYCQPIYSDKRDCYIFIRRLKN